MDVKDFQDGKIITLSKAFDSKAKLIFLSEFILFFTGGFIFFMYFFKDGFSTALIILNIIFLPAFFIAAYKFANKALFSEQIFVNQKEIYFISRGIFKHQTPPFSISKISNFRHIKKKEPTKHPLAGKSFDYMGFETEQKMINEMHGHNRIAFDYDGKSYVFGENIFSWQFEELEILLYDITGNDFRYDDEFEKTIPKS